MWDLGAAHRRRARQCAKVRDALTDFRVLEAPTMTDDDIRAYVWACGPFVTLSKASGISLHNILDRAILFIKKDIEYDH